MNGVRRDERTCWTREQIGITLEFNATLIRELFSEDEVQF